jgi:sialate O-acetylesterase
MIADWRARWQRPDLPFLFVQIAPHYKMPPELRNSQLMTWKNTSGTAMVVTTDVGDAEDIHPTRKETVGSRLALAARGTVYGEKIVYSGPVFTHMTVEDELAVLHFNHTGGGLVAKDGPLRGFTISGDGKTFVPAEADISGETVKVHAAGVTTPVAARYGWANVPEVNLFNAGGLPASPFRTESD